MNFLWFTMHFQSFSTFKTNRSLKHYSYEAVDVHKGPCLFSNSNTKSLTRIELRGSPERSRFRPKGVASAAADGQESPRRSPCAYRSSRMAKGRAVAVQPCMPVACYSGGSLPAAQRLRGVACEGDKRVAEPVVCADGWAEARSSGNAKGWAWPAAPMAARLWGNPRVRGSEQGGEWGQERVRSSGAYF
jgi:hypothetical protein